MVSSGRMPPPPKKPQKKPRAISGATRPELKIKKPPAKIKKAFDRFRWEFYGGAILTILVVVLPMTSYVKGIFLAVLVAWVSIHKQYRDDTKQRLREPVAQILATGSKMQDACLSGNSEEAETAATAWGGETGKWLTDNLGSAEAMRFNNPAGQILPGSRYNP